MSFTFDIKSQTNTIVVEDYWSSVREFPTLYKSINYESSKVPSQKVLLEDNWLPISLNIFGNYSYVLEIVDSGIIERVRAISVFLEDTNLSIIKNYSQKFKNLQFLQVAIYSDNSVYQFPFEYFQSLELIGLAINGNVQRLSGSIKAINKLEYLQIGSDSLEFISQEISKFKNLKSLYISGSLKFKENLKLKNMPFINNIRDNWVIKVNISNAKKTNFSTNSLKIDFENLENLMLVLNQEANLYYSIPHAFNFLFIKQGLNQHKNVLSVRKLLCNGDCRYQDMIIGELILDSIERINNLNNCTVFRLTAEQPQVDFNWNNKGKFAGLSNNKIHSISFGNYIYFIEYLENGPAIDFSRSQYFNIITPIRATNSNYNLNDSFGCLYSSWGFNFLDVRKFRGINNYFPKYLKNSNYWQASGIDIDTMDVFASGILDSLKNLRAIKYNNCEINGIRKLNNENTADSLSIAYFFGKRLNRSIAKNIKEVKAETLILTFKAFSKSTTIKLNKNCKVFSLNKKPGALKVNLTKTTPLKSIYISANNVAIKHLGFAQELNIIYRNSIKIKFGSNSYIENFNILQHGSQKVKANFQFFKKEALLIHTMHVNILSNELIRNMEGVKIEELIVDSVLEQVDLSFLTQVKKITIFHFTPKIDFNQLVSSINEMPSLYYLSFGDLFPSKYITYLREDIKVAIFFKYYQQNLSQLDYKCRLLVTISQEEIDTFDWSKYIFKRNLNIIKNY